MSGPCLPSSSMRNHALPATLPFYIMSGITHWQAGIPRRMDSMSYFPNRGTLAQSEYCAPPLRMQMEDSYLQYRPAHPVNGIRPPLDNMRGQFAGGLNDQNQSGAATKAIGAPIKFNTGRFAGHTIRTELHEIQRPDYGRRFGVVDRRVLDDPPALEGLMCMAELFEMPKDAQGAPRNTNAVWSQTSGRPTLTLVNGQPITMECNRTASLFGTKFVEPQRISWADSGSDKKWLMFVFSWIHVNPGRYRFFDIFSNPAGCTSPTILAECYGGPFKIYSTKLAPPLEKSSALIKSLAQHGVRVNVRKQKRHRRTKTDVE
ncbi:hypothetical protein C8R43DRAFT_1113176, partial [Mycena crocata]